MNRFYSIPDKKMIQKKGRKYLQNNYPGAGQKDLSCKTASVINQRNSFPAQKRIYLGKQHPDEHQGATE